MSMRLVKFVAPAILALAAGTASAQHGHGGGGAHAGGAHVGGYHGGAVYHGGAYHSGVYHGGYYHNGYGGYGGYGYGRGYGYGLGYGLGYGYGGYGLGYGGYGLGYGGYGYGSYSPYSSYPYYDNYPYPYTDSGTYYPPTASASSVTRDVIQASGIGVQNNLIPSTSASDAASPAIVTVVVPDGAQVWFDGKEDTATGTDRVFTSSALQPGQRSVLSVKAQWDGKMRTMQIPMVAGDKMSVDLRAQ